MEEIFIDLQKAYQRRKEESEMSKEERNQKVIMERKEEGICVDCGKELSKKEKESYFIRCWKCRYKKR